MKTNPIPGCLARYSQSFTIAVALLRACCIGNLMAQTPCPDVQVIATNLLGPAKVIQTPQGNFLVAEVGMPDQFN